MPPAAKTPPSEGGSLGVLSSGEVDNLRDNAPPVKNQAPRAAAALPLDLIKIRNRFRQDLGNIKSLAQNFEEIGLLHPIVIQPDGSLIAGARRLLAFKALGRETIPVTVVDLEKVVLGEYGENTFRKAFTPSECADIADALEPIERAAAKERQATAGPTNGRGAKPTGSGKFPEAVKGNALDKVAKAAGKDRKTIQKARAIRDAAKAEPEKFGKLQKDMDRTGRVDGPFKRLGIMRQSALIRAEPPPLPGYGPYRVIVADPPWPYEIGKEDPSLRATHPFPQMSIEQICAVDVPCLAHADCLLWLWTTNHHMRHAFEVRDWRLAARPDRPLPALRSREAGGRADKPGDALAGAATEKFTKAGRVLQLH